MSKQFEHDEVSKVSFHDLLNAAIPALKSKAFVKIELDFKTDWQEGGCEL